MLTHDMTPLHSQVSTCVVSSFLRNFWSSETSWQVLIGDWGETGLTSLRVRVLGIIALFFFFFLLKQKKVYQQCHVLFGSYLENCINLLCGVFTDSWVCLAQSPLTHHLGGFLFRCQQKRYLVAQTIYERWKIWRLFGDFKVRVTPTFLLFKVSC